MTDQPPSTPPAPPGYNAAAGGGPIGTAPKISGLAIASLVAGLAGFCIPIVGGSAGLVLGIVALRQIGRSGGTVGGKGLAIGGVVASAVSLLFGLVVAIILVGGAFVVQKRAVGMREHVREDLTCLQIEMTAHALDVYEVDLGHYPTEAEGGLRALREKPAGAGADWAGPYLRETPTDAWDRPLRYEPPDPARSDIRRHTYRVWSVGPDGINGTPDDVER